MAAPLRSRNARRLPAIAIGGASALLVAGVTYLAWSYLGGSPPHADTRGRDDDYEDEAGPASGRSASTSASGALGGPRPTLCLSLPPSFDARDAASVRALRLLLRRLAPLFVVHLVCPYHQATTRHGTADGLAHDAEELELEIDLSSHATQPPLASDAPRTPREHANEEEEALLGSLAAQLADVDGWDARRTLLYAKTRGRHALARALACDAHCEVLLEPVGAPDDLAGSTAALGAAVKGRSTTRVPSARSSQARLQRYSEALSLLRKSTGLLVLVALPRPGNPTPTAESDGWNSDDGDGVGSEGEVKDDDDDVACGGAERGVDVRELLDLFRPSGGGGGAGTASLGVRVVDVVGSGGARRDQGGALATGAGEWSYVEAAWEQGAQAVARLRKGWR